MLGLKVQDNAEFGAEIIRKVRDRGALSRVELARELCVAASTIGRHVDELVEKKYFTEKLEPTREAGRPPVRLRPNPKRGCFIGVDFNADQLFATAFDFAQESITQKRYTIHGSKGVAHVLGEVAGALQDMQAATKLPVLAAGVAAPGRVDTRKGIATRYVHIPGWQDVPLAARMKEIVGTNVFIKNNIRAMALAERWFGEGRGCQDIVTLGVRIGVSAGIIRDGNISSGFRSLGGEIRGWNCPVFNAQTEKWEWLPGATIEKHASVPAIIARYSEMAGRKVTQNEFLDAANQGVPHAITAVREGAAIHGWAISQMVQLIDPEIVVLAGPLTLLGNLYLESVCNIALQFESDYHPSVPIKISALGEYAGAVGAAALALESWRPDDVA